MGQFNLRAARAFAAVTPSDSVDIGTGSAGLWVSGAGAVSVTDRYGVTTVFTVPAGTVLPINPARVNATGTTATGIVALYD